MFVLCSLDSISTPFSQCSYSVLSTLFQPHSLNVRLLSSRHYFNPILLMFGLCSLDIISTLFHYFIESMIVCVSIFSCSFSVRMYYCTALSVVFDWICALQVFVIIIIINPSLLMFVLCSPDTISTAVY